MTFLYRKIIIGCVVLLLLVTGIFVYGYVTKQHMPAVPFPGISKQELYHLGNASQNSMTYVVKDKEHHWYIFKGNHSQGRRIVVSELAAFNYIFVEQMGAGHIFRHPDHKETLIVTSQQWSSNFIVYKFPDHLPFINDYKHELRG